MSAQLSGTGSPDRSPSRFVAVVPVKPPAFGKSRLGDLGDDQRRRLAAAFALDTAAACLAARSVARVLVATDDAPFSAQLMALGCAAVPDGDTNDLNAALRQAASEAHRRWPDLEPVALCADLPALLPADLDAALESLVPGGPSFVADADGVGTTLYTAPYDEFDPQFGADSCQAHLLTGALELRGALATLRRDVDDLDDLRAAAALGLGPRTAALVEELGLA
ncbi:2-phospho-L-lactate guanylyltransferase [Nocardioides marmotae]|uniref:2-phospho-L-lactate guanylyltransferase n=1 Tax=Nocardioides marmotae TaxID=2663857 RepID=A0A6I3JB85_9ACTN|nr:2-phospho-L-lactate guanylyltransferase [Nocardioides marmotae]MCR6031755.1 2-phospho-L-lactate guanylyltransferase [Gordonia jinghuaiqii]MBC9735065.1 2-phospho-L-lactate guanylyltransferase [Nocardioides marmotae]MTB86165.1 2-phospho-L-lactate guanylyltransferase [Nocardioides marmotae]MTB95394.1 2-phospho-L-lactate guanylyltransferase [Nocardioides marmotae]QKE00839.1 2-phospho-L-lactate guanylyltransferase [Nocardioides marmotae]